MAVNKLFSKTFLKCILIIIVFVSSCSTAFHSKKRCCICLKKRQDGKKFLSSKALESLFPTIFKVPNESRKGDLCRVCYMTNGKDKWKKTKKVANEVC